VGAFKNQGIPQTKTLDEELWPFFEELHADVLRSSRHGGRATRGRRGRTITQKLSSFFRSLPPAHNGGRLFTPEKRLERLASETKCQKSPGAGDI
jgi:hypothetical protein